MTRLSAALLSLPHPFIASLHHMITHILSIVMMRRLSVVFLLLPLCVAASADKATIHRPSKCPLKPPSSIRTAPLVIAHRGASFHVPEHTLEAYRLALELGADYIEPDLVGTKDGHLVVVHSINLNITTNVAEVFPDRYTTLQSYDETGYYSHEFTLQEIQQLKVKQRMPPPRSADYDGLFGVPSFQETLALLHEWNQDILPLLTEEPSLERAGVYAELKDPEIYQEETNRSMVDVFFNELKKAADKMPFLDGDVVCDSLKYDQYVVPPLVVQSFDAPALKEVHEQWTYNSSLPLVLLAPASKCFKEDFWFHTGESRDFIHGIGVDKKCLLTKEYREFMNKAEELELPVHAWVERKELSEVSDDFQNMQQELKHLYCNVGVHGVFAENVADAVLVGQVGCDKNTTEEEEAQPPTMAPTTLTTNSSQDANGAAGGDTSNPGSLCYASDDEQAMYVGIAAGIMGIFIGVVFTLCISNSRCCRKRRLRRHQMVVPQHDDGEMI